MNQNMNQGLNTTPPENLATSELQMTSMAWAIKQPGLSPMQKSALIAIAAYQSPEGYASVTRTALMATSGMARPTLSRALKELTARGLVEVRASATEHGATEANRYYLLNTERGGNDDAS